MLFSLQVQAAVKEEGGEEGGVEDHPADSRMAVEDLLEGLGGDKKKKKKKAVSAGGEGEATEAAAAATPAGPKSFQDRLAKQKEAGVVEARSKAAEAAALKAVQPLFVASKKFAGARAGYVFQMGPQGLGYYVDRPPRPAGKPVQKKGPIVPIGPQGANKRGSGNWFDSSSDEEEEEKGEPSKGSKKQKQGGAAGVVQKKAPAAKKQQQQQPAAGGSDDGGVEEPASGGGDDDVSDEELFGGGLLLGAGGDGGGHADGKKKRKALPGRLRKKLAMQKQKQGGQQGKR